MTEETREDGSEEKTYKEDVKLTSRSTVNEDRTRGEDRNKV